MTDSPIKNLTIKHVGTGKPADVVGVEPGTRVSDLLSSLGLTGGYHLVDPHNPDVVYRGTDDLYSRVEDGQVLAVTALLDAGANAIAFVKVTA